MAEVKQNTQDLIDKHQAMVFIKNGCPYCTATMDLLARKEKQIGFKYELLDIKGRSDEYAIQDALGEIAAELKEKETGKEAKKGRALVPSIWLDHKRVENGNDGLQRLDKDGKLDGTLQEIANKQRSAA